MIRYVKTSNMEEVENFLLRVPEAIFYTTRYEYYFRQVGDCAGIFRKKRTKGAKEELCIYYHEGEF